MTAKQAERERLREEERERRVQRVRVRVRERISIFRSLMCKSQCFFFTTGSEQQNYTRLTEQACSHSTPAGQNFTVTVHKRRHDVSYWGEKLAGCLWRAASFSVDRWEQSPVGLPVGNQAYWLVAVWVCEGLQKPGSRWLCAYAQGY